MPDIVGSSASRSHRLRSKILRRAFFNGLLGDKFGTGRGFGTRHRSFCQTPIPRVVLYGEKVFRVGTVLSGVRALIGDGVAPDAVGHRRFHLMELPGITMTDGHLLVVRDDEAATCVRAHLSQLAFEFEIACEQPSFLLALAVSSY